MPDKTDYLGFQLWNNSEEGWEHRSDFEILDTRVVDHGPIDNRPNTAPTGALYLATDCNILYQWVNNEGWMERAGAGTEKEALSEQHVKSLQSNNIYVRDNSGTVFAREFPGDGLGEKIDHAVTYLSENVNGRGRIRVTPRDDGDVWQWHSEIEIEPPSREGLHLDIDENVRIEYTGDGQQLEYWGHTYEDNLDRISQGFAPLVLSGGYWEFTGNPDGWLKTHDLTASTIHPRAVRNCTNTNGTACCLEIRHYKYWSEVTSYSGWYRGDIGIEFKHGNYLNDVPGTHNSFHGTALLDCYLSALENNVIIRGNWSFCNVRNLQLWGSDSDVDLLTFGAYRMDGTVFNTVKFETPGGYDNVTAVVIDEEYDGYYGPLIIMPKMGSNINRYRQAASWNGGNGDVTTIDAFGRGFSVHNYENDERVDIRPGSGLYLNNTPLEVGEWMPMEELDVRTIDESELSAGVWAQHDGSGENTRGPSWYTGSAWKSTVDDSWID